jgi:formate hydrogenlyase subunit 4
MSWPIALVLYILHALIVPLLFIGLLRAFKSRLQNRRGAPILQPFLDFFKLLSKGETVSTTTSGLFRIAPIINLAALIAASLMVPWLGMRSPIAGDLFLVVYLLAAGKFCMGLAALDTGSAFGALGASREAAVSIQSEPALVLGLAALGVHAHSSRLSVLLTGAPGNEMTMVLAALVIVAAWVAIIADLSRMPVDDPATHLELTMVHEALILENSGRNLALIEYAVALKTSMLIGLVAQIVLMTIPLNAPVATYGFTLLLLVSAAFLLAVSETVLVKLSWKRVPNLQSFGMGAALLACLLVALKG